MKTDTEISGVLDEHDRAHRVDLKRIGDIVGFGRAQHILGELWDEMLKDRYGFDSGRGKMGVTVDDNLPPVPRAAHSRRDRDEIRGYVLVPAYTKAEMEAYARAAIEYSRREGK